MRLVERRQSKGASTSFLFEEPHFAVVTLQVFFSLVLEHSKFIGQFLLGVFQPDNFLLQLHVLFLKFPHSPEIHALDGLQLLVQ
jgi:hypothetical protein